jgi:hypothetical protein
MWMIVTLLGVVIILYASMLPGASARKPVQEDFLDSVGDTLQHFAEEIEEENKELLRMVGDMKQDHEKRTNTLLLRIEQLERQSASMQDRLGKAPEGNESAPGAGMAAGTEGKVLTKPARLPSQISTASMDSSPAPVLTTGERETKDEAGSPSRFAATVKSRYKELFDLYDSGKSVEYIAKKLGKNKGEVLLIVGLARQEEPQHGQP